MCESKSRASASGCLLLRGSGQTYDEPSGGWETGLWRCGDGVVTYPGNPPVYGCTVWARMAIDEALNQIEAELQKEGERVLTAVRGAMRALGESDKELAEEVIAFDDEIDQLFLGIERSIQALLALQTPVARDLRLLLAMLHINLLLERTADGCVTVAKLTQLVADAEPDAALVEVLAEMGDRAEEMFRVALD